MKNKYSFRSRISEKKIREIVRYFAVDLTALQAAELSGLNRNTVNRLYLGLRERILVACEAQRPMFGVVEVDESLFRAKRVKGKRGHDAYGAPMAKRPSLASSSAKERFTPRSSQTVKPRHYMALSGARLMPPRSSTPMAGVATTAL